MPPAPIPGEARIARVVRRLAVIRDVRLAAGDQQAPADALLDTGATYCVVLEEVADRLNFQPGERLGVERVQGVLGRVATMQRYRLENMRAGTAQVYGVDILVGEAVLGLMLLGMSFIGKFTTTLDLDAGRVIFRPRLTDR